MIGNEERKEQRMSGSTEYWGVSSSIDLYEC